MLTFQPGDIFADNYELKRLIDTGGFAEVWEAVFLAAGNTVALKIYPKLDADGVKNIEEEYKTQVELLHSHLLIARYFGKYNGHPFLEMRYCAGGNAFAKIGNCNEAEIAKCLYQVGSALEYLHHNNIVHQDIKPNNFLLDAEGNYYLADLGLSLRVRNTIKKFTQSKTGQTTSIQTGLTPPPYRAPELYDRASIGADPIKASDIWAMGASLYELVTAQVPFGEFGGLIQLNQPEVPELPAGFSKELNMIVARCLSKETWNRPKAAELAQWAKNYIDTGRYGVQPENQPAAAATLPHSAGNTQTVLQQEPGKKKMQPALLWSIILIVIAGSSFGLWKWMGDKKPIINTDYINTDSTGLVKPDSNYFVADTTKTVDSPIVKKNDSGPDSLFTGYDGGTKKEDKPIVKKTPPKVEEPKIIYNPSVDRNPLGSQISITKVERTSKNVIITFRLQRKNSTETFTIYGPEDQAHCFHLESNKRKYRLLAVSEKGQVQFGSANTKSFRATFEKVPDYITKVNIWEGTDFTRKEMNYWNFRGVQISK